MVNALSEWLELTVWRGGIEHWMRFEHGDAVAHRHRFHLVVGHIDGGGAQAPL